MLLLKNARCRRRNALLRHLGEGDDGIVLLRDYLGKDGIFCEGLSDQLAESPTTPDANPGANHRIGQPEEIALHIAYRKQALNRRVVFSADLGVVVNVESEWNDQH